MKTTRHKSILFDLDGTLLNTLEDIADSMNSVLVRHGFSPHPADAYRYFIGDGVEKLARRALPQNIPDQKIVAQCATGMKKEYSQRWDRKTKPYAGVPELLNLLTEQGIRMAILSNKPDAFTRLAINHFLSDWHFEKVAGALPGVPKKPAPDGALRIASEMKLLPEEYIYLGDSNTDMQTALAAGMVPIGAGWGFRTIAELRANGAREVFDRPEDVLRFFNFT